MPTPKNNQILSNFHKNGIEVQNTSHSKQKDNHERTE